MAVETLASKTINRAAPVLTAAAPRFVQCRPVQNRAPARIQTALKVSSPKDPAEKEAEVTAKKIMRMAVPESSIAFVPTAGGGGVFRQVKPEEKEKKLLRQADLEKERKVQRFVSPYIARFAGSGIFTQRPEQEEKKVQRLADTQPDVSSNLAAEIQSSAAGGSPLPLSVRRFMEPRFGADFSGVKVHTDERAARMSRGVNAHAFTLGNSVFFGKDKFRPETEDGRELIAHELTHTIQQGAAVQRREDVAVTQQSPPTVQRGIISRVLDYFADKAYNIPGFRMFTIVIGFNPINMERADRSGANILRAIIEFLPGGHLITEALENNGVFQKVGDWIGRQFATLASIGADFKQALDDFIDSLGWSDVFHLGRVWDRAKALFLNPIHRLIDFGKGLVSDIIKFIKDAILRPLAKLAEGTRGYDLLKAVLGEDPVTGDKVPQTADTLIGGFMKLIGQEEIWENIKRANAIPRAWAWFKTALGGLLALVRSIPGRFINAFKSLTISDIILVPRAFTKIASVFVGFIADFISWAGETIWSLLEIIFAVVAPAAMPYLKKAAGAFRTIIKNPVGFIMNLVRAAKQGFLQFAGRFLTHLKNSLIQWLTGALPGVYIPQALNLREIIKFVLSVLGLTWANIRAKLVKAVGETAVKAMETGFDIVVTLVTQGPAAAWEKIKEALGNLQQIVIDGVMEFVRSKIVQAAVTKLLSMLSPAGAFIQAIIAIYNTIMFFIERLRQIIQVATAFIDSIAAIAGGAIAAAANRVETVMAGLLTLVISFLARIAGLGKVSDAVMNIIDKIRQPIDRGLDLVVNWIVTMAKSAGRLVARGVQRVMEWWRERKSFAIGDEQHELSIAGEPTRPQVMMASARAQGVREILAGRPQSANTARCQRIMDEIDTLITTHTAAQGTSPETDTLRAQIQAKLGELATILPSVFGGPLPLTTVTYQMSGGLAQTATAMPLTKKAGNTQPSSSTSAAILADSYMTALNSTAQVWVKMHLISWRLMGPNAAWNFAAGDKSANGNMSSLEVTTENLLKGAVPAANAPDERVRWYQTTVTYHPNDPGNPNLKYFCATISVTEGRYDPATGAKTSQTHGPWKSALPPLTASVVIVNFSQSGRAIIQDSIDPATGQKLGSTAGQRVVDARQLLFAAKGRRNWGTGAQGEADFKTYMRAAHASDALADRLIALTHAHPTIFKLE